MLFVILRHHWTANGPFNWGDPQTSRVFWAEVSNLLRQRQRLAPTTEREFQFVAALRTQLASREWKLVTGPSACGSIVTTRLHPHHEQGYIVALRLPVREHGHLF